MKVPKAAKQRIARAKGKVLVVGLGRDMEARGPDQSTWVNSWPESEWACVDLSKKVKPDIAGNFTRRMKALRSRHFGAVYFQYVPLDALTGNSNYGIKQAHRVLEPGGLLAVITIPYVLTVTFFYMWWGGTSTPARFLGPVLLVLGIPAAGWMAARKTTAGRAFGRAMTTAFDKNSTTSRASSFCGNSRSSGTVSNCGIFRVPA